MGRLPCALALVVLTALALAQVEEPAIGAAPTHAGDAKHHRSVTSGANAGVAFANAVTMTIATELGDKTFCIAAVMAMRYNRTFVFLGAIGALLVMTVLSVAIGVAVPTLLPKTYTHYAAAGLFAYFGVKLLREAREMKGGDGGHSELRETEEELGGGAGAGGDGGAGAAVPTSPSAAAADGASPGGALLRHGAGGADVEAGGGVAGAPLAGGGAGGAAAGGGNGAAPTTLLLSGNGSGGGGGGATGAVAGDDDPSLKSGRGKPSQRGGAGAGPVWRRWAVTAMHVLRTDWVILTQAFTLTFLAEWGDRSQIATIAMAAAQHPVGVCLGAFVGHSLCTGLAVVGGRILASRISERTVAFMGGILFVLFAMHSVWAGPDVDE